MKDRFSSTGYEPMRMEPTGIEPATPSLQS